MRISMMAVAVALVFGGAVTTAQETSDKQLLRCKFEKGQKFQYKLDQKMALTLEQIPEQFEEMIGKKPFSLHLKATLEMVVEEVNEKGVATLKGKFKTARATGKALVDDIDFTYDSSKPNVEKEDEEEPGNPFGMDPSAMLRELVTQELTMTIDSQGRLKIEGSEEGAGGMSNQILNFNGLMGSLPAKKVGVGDSWKTKESLGIPNVGQLKVNLRAKNTVQKFASIEGKECAVITSKYTVATAADEGGDEEEEEGMFNLDAKMTGKGSGKTVFSISAGHVLTTNNSVKVNIAATMADPQGGDDLEFKASLKMEQKGDLRR